MSDDTSREIDGKRLMIDLALGVVFTGLVLAITVLCLFTLTDDHTAIHDWPRVIVVILLSQIAAIWIVSRAALGILEEFMKSRTPRPATLKFPDGVEPPDDMVHCQLSVSPEMSLFWDKLAADARRTKAGTFDAAICLYRVAIDAYREGKRLVVVDDKDDSEVELVGFFKGDQSRETPETGPRL